MDALLLKNKSIYNRQGLETFQNNSVDAKICANRAQKRAKYINSIHNY